MADWIHTAFDFLMLALSTAVVGAIIGTVLAFGVFALIHWFTHHHWQEFWGLLLAPTYGGLPGACVGAVIGVVRAYRDTRR